MAERLTEETLDTPVHEHMRTDFVHLHPDMTVGQALEFILETQPAGRIIYFYVVDGDGRLRGVVPTRGLLLSPRDKLLSQILITPVVALPKDATVLDACAFFTLHKLLAFPVVDEERRMIGLVDVDMYTRELRDLDRWESHNDLFQLIGVQVTEAQQRSVPALFRRRLPWLLATLAGGLLTAAISDFYYSVASLILVLPFIPLVLALSSSVAAQSVSLALQTLHGQDATWAKLRSKLNRELAIGVLLGVACGLIVAMVAFVWKGDTTTSLGLLGSIVGGVTCAAVLGFATPYLFRMLGRNPQVAAGPITLAAADVASLLVYFNIARVLIS